MSDLQRTEEWFKDRLGRPTASNYSKLVTSTGKPSTSADAYINELIAQRLTGELPEQITSVHIERGIELESKAISWFEFETDLEVIESGFIKHPVLETGCSPDGLIGEDSGIEIKCPAAHTHVGYLRSGKLPAKYVQQVQGSMWVTGRKHWFFLSYHPEMPKLLIRVDRDEEIIKSIEEAVTKACEKIETEYKSIKETYKND
jgi:hypothetical protein